MILNIKCNNKVLKKRKILFNQIEISNNIQKNLTQLCI